MEAHRLDTAAEAPVPAPARLINRRMLAGLGAVAAAQALLICLAALPGLGCTEVLTPQVLPAALVGLALGLGLLLAPFWTEERASGSPADEELEGGGRRREGTDLARSARSTSFMPPCAARLAPAVFVAVWQAAALGYFLLVASRLAPLEAAGAVRSLLAVGAALWLAAALARRFPRAYTGVVFLWAVAVPVGCYLVAEVFVSTPAGAVGWRQAAGPGAEALRAVVDWLLSLSPGTAAVGTLSGVLPGGGSCGWLEAGVFCAVSLSATLGVSGFLQEKGGYAVRD